MTSPFCRAMRRWGAERRAIIDGARDLLRRLGCVAGGGVMLSMGCWGAGASTVRSDSGQMSASGGSHGSGGSEASGGASGTGGGAAAGASGAGGDTAVCTSGTMWDNQNGPDMSPGIPCSSCHSTFTVSGTVYPTLHDPYNCNGTDGATGVKVLVTGADGVTLTLTPSKAGNFYSTTPVATPYTVQLVNGAASRAMMTPQFALGCNICHAPQGVFQAPGRILAP